MKCDCAEQLAFALDYIKKEGKGLVIYLQQEGRGIGISNKIAAYALQEVRTEFYLVSQFGYVSKDTTPCKQTRLLVFQMILESTLLSKYSMHYLFSLFQDILDDLQIKSVNIMTNNPRKIEQLQSLGIIIADRTPIRIESNPYNVQYLKVRINFLSLCHTDKRNKDETHVGFALP